MSTQLSTELDRIAARCAADPKASAFSAAIEQPASGFTWVYGDTDRPYFIASITKLYTVAMIMQLRAEHALTLETRAAELLGVDTMRGLNVHDYGPAITVRELLAQTSGIPDYYEQGGSDGARPSPVTATPTISYSGGSSRSSPPAASRTHCADACSNRWAWSTLLRLATRFPQRAPRSPLAG